MEKIIKKKYKVAVIEDEAIMSKALVEELEDADFDVVKAFDGEQGLDLLLREEPDVALLDIVMPKMDGMTMLKKLRESGEVGQRMPVILLTNLNPGDRIMNGVIENEPSYYLVKSRHTLGEILAKVRSCLDK